MHGRTLIFRLDQPYMRRYPAFIFPAMCASAFVFPYHRLFDDIWADNADGDINNRLQKGGSP